MSILTDLLDIYTDIVPEIIDVYISTFGIFSDIYYAVAEDKLYDDHGKVKYNSTPDETGRQLLIINFIRNNSMRGNFVQFESFFNDDRPFILSYEDKRLPPRTRIDAWLGNAKISFQTEIDEAITGTLKMGGTRSTQLVKQILRPLT